MQLIHYYFLRIIQDKYISLYRELITQMHTYVLPIRVLAKGYLPNTLLTPRKLQGVLAEFKKSLYHTNPDYTLVLDRLFIQPYTQKPLILYKLEIVPVPILDENIEAQSYTHLKVKKPYLALNSETYISLTHQELRSCKKIGNEFCCKELFIVKHKSGL